MRAGDAHASQRGDAAGLPLERRGQQAELRRRAVDFVDLEKGDGLQRRLGRVGETGHGAVAQRPQAALIADDRVEARQRERPARAARAAGQGEAADLRLAGPLADRDRLDRARRARGRQQPHDGLGLARVAADRVLERRRDAARRKQAIVDDDRARAVLARLQPIDEDGAGGGRGLQARPMGQRLRRAADAREAQHQQHVGQRIAHAHGAEIARPQAGLQHGGRGVFGALRQHAVVGDPAGEGERGLQRLECGLEEDGVADVHRRGPAQNR